MLHTEVISQRPWWRSHVIAWAFLAAVALLVRLPELSQRPMHSDEAVNAWITGSILSGTPFRYDPQDRHGPVLWLWTVPLAWCSGARDLAGLNEGGLRLGPVLAGIGLILLCRCLAPGTGKTAAFATAVFWALGPLPVYYARYFIHETLFAGATLGWLILVWRGLGSGGWWNGLVAGACAALMLGCKETAVLSFAALGVAIPVGWGGLGPKKRLGSWMGGALSALIAGTVLLYTWGMQDWAGPGRLLGSFGGFLQRAEGVGHAKPFWYYGALLAGGWSGVGVWLLAGVGMMHIWRQTGASFGKMVSIYGGVLFVIYSAIPYKTPWLALNLWLPLTILAGCGVAASLSAAQGRLVRSVWLAGCAMVLVALAVDVRERVFRDAAGEQNPYAYAHNTGDLQRLPGRLSPAKGDGQRMAVVLTDPWPLPWVLRREAGVGYWQPEQDPGAADMYVTGPVPPESLQARLAGWRPEYFGVRPGVLITLWKPQETP